MKYRKAVFIVTYFIEKNKIYYLVLKRKLHWKGWEFPKGGKGFLESSNRAVKRELFEETGKKPIKITKFNKKGKYNYNKKLKDRPGILGQNYNLFSAEIEKGKIKIDKKEHSGYKWTTYKEALKKLTWKNQRECLKIVNRDLMSK